MEYKYISIYSIIQITFFFYKNTLYKKTEAQITQKLITMARLDARTQQKTSSRMKNGSYQFKINAQTSNEFIECTSSEET